MINVEKALEELKTKTYRDIQKETTYTWASRACASYQNCVNEEDPTKRLVHWTVGEELYHESIEHAALCEGEEDLLKQIREAVHPYQEKAAAKMAPGHEKELDIP